MGRYHVLCADVVHIMPDGLEGGGIMGNGEWGMGNGEWGMGNGEWGMGNGGYVSTNPVVGGLLH